ncbi:AlpA family transcriptional regulator [Pandoraea sputorum]|uniref:helix-turn-helix transcriptional regulator n=1 Tax=Pandoraea sputorum TaxID=93222 RepID=UPI001E39A4E9|nr:AlpA family transcriptional regulator [Pandoraea sputorum]MCE4062695.1 AlpA family transcriptional regulator [Pandoraea sputorum]
MNNQPLGQENPTTVTLLRRPDVERITGLSRSSIYAKMKTGEFPRSIPLTNRIVAWLESEILGWVRSRIDVRETNLGRVQSRIEACASSSGQTNPQRHLNRIRHVSQTDCHDDRNRGERRETPAAISTEKCKDLAPTNVTSTGVNVGPPEESADYPTNLTNVAIDDSAKT